MWWRRVICVRGVFERFNHITQTTYVQHCIAHSYHYTLKNYEHPYLYRRMLRNTKRALRARTQSLKYLRSNTGTRDDVEEDEMEEEMRKKEEERIEALENMEVKTG